MSPTHHSVLCAAVGRWADERSPVCRLCQDTPQCSYSSQPGQLLRSLLKSQDPVSYLLCLSPARLVFEMITCQTLGLWFIQLLFSVSSDLLITDASRSCLRFIDVIVCLVFLWIYVCQLLTLSHTIHVFCLHNYALYPVIRLYCGLILLECVRFLASFFAVYIMCIVLFYFLWTLSEINLDGWMDGW